MRQAAGWRESCGAYVTQDSTTVGAVASRSNLSEHGCDAWLELDLLLDRYGAMKIFVKVAELGSFAEAARALYLSPPAVTRAVASLEISIGSRLFVRTTRAVKI